MEDHEVTLAPHPDVKTLSTAKCECGDAMRHPGTKGIINDWIQDHWKKIRDESLAHLPRTW